MPVPTKGDLKRFCEIDNWDETRSSDHYRYRKTLDTGEVLRTRVSFDSDGDSAFDDPGLWVRVWRQQLGLDSEDERWRSTCGAPGNSCRRGR